MKQIIITIDESKLRPNDYITIEDIINKLEDNITDAVDYGYWLEFIWNEFEYIESEEEAREVVYSIADAVDYEIKDLDKID